MTSGLEGTVSVGTQTLVGSWHVGSFWTRDCTRVSDIGTGGFFTTEPPGKPVPSGVNLLRPYLQIRSYSEIPGGQELGRHLQPTRGSINH